MPCSHKTTALASQVQVEFSSNETIIPSLFNLLSPMERSCSLHTKRFSHPFSPLEVKQTVLPLLLILLSPAQRSGLHQTKRFSGPSSSNIVSNDSHTPAHLLRSSSHQTEEVKIPSHLSSSYSISGRSKVHIKRNASHTPPYRRDQNDKSTPSTLLSPA